MATPRHRAHTHTRARATTTTRALSWHACTLGAKQDVCSVQWRSKAPRPCPSTTTEQRAKTTLPPSESSDEEPAFVGTAVGSAVATLPVSVGSAAVVPLPPRGTKQRPPDQCQDHSKVGKFRTQSFQTGKHACERAPRDQWWWWCWRCGLCICVAYLWGALQTLLRSVRPGESGGVGANGTHAAPKAPGVEDASPSGDCVSFRPAA